MHGTAFLVFQTLLMLQLCGFLASLSCTFLLMRLKSFVDLKFLLVAALCADVYAAGYFVELHTKSLEAAMVAYAFEYMGLAFIALSYVRFIAEYCGVTNRIPTWFWMVGYGFGIFVVFCVFFYRYNPLYYTEVLFDEGGFFPHIVSKKGVFYYLFAVYEMGLLLFGSLLLWHKRKMTTDKDDRRKITHLFIECSFAVLSLLAAASGLMGGYDSSSFVICIVFILTTITATRGRAFDITGVTAAARNETYQNVDTGIIVTDVKHRYLDSNNAANRMFPELTEMVQGRDLCVHETEIFTEDNDYTFEQNGRIYRAKYDPLISDKQQLGYTVIIADITDMRRNMDQIRELKDQAEAANEAKSVFLANMSHEIRTPLNAIIGMAELTQKEKSKTVIKEYVGQMKSAGEILLGIVSDVLDFSKAESGKLDLVPVEFNFSEFMNSIVTVANMRIGEQPVDFIVDIDPKIPSVIYGNDVHIRQIFMNLLSNAEKFTETGHIKLTVDFKEEDDNNIRLYASVEDTGIGIKEENMGDLFEAFAQIDIKKNRWKTGTGLGLAIFAQLVTLMGGTYRVESEYGKGSTFFFDIKVGVIDKTPFGGDAERKAVKVEKLATADLYNRHASDEQKNEDTESKAFSDYSTKNILVVDDNKVNVRVLSAFLKHYGIEADSAYSGQEAIDMVQKKRYDLIFMDQMMPEMDGIEATMKIRELGGNFASIPIIACTANVVKGVEESFYEAGMNDFVPKPIRFENLGSKLAKYLS